MANISVAHISNPSYHNSNSKSNRKPAISLSLVMSKKSRRLFFTLLLSLFFLLITCIAVYWLLNRFDREKRTYYADFQIHLPENYQIHGIDVSKYQKKIAWDMVSGMKVGNIKLGFVFIKATQGNGMVDTRFERNWYHAKRVGMARGAYHYFNVHQSGRSQAHNFMQIVKLSEGDLPPVLDIEQLDGVPESEMRDNMRNWLETITTHYGVKPIIYTYADFYEDHLLGFFDDYPLWIAHYHNGQQPRANRSWHFWQHNEDGRVNGIDAPVDFNVFQGDSASFNNLLLKANN